MRYIAFKWHRILISFDVVTAGKKKSRRRDGRKKQANNGDI